MFSFFKQAKLLIPPGLQPPDYQGLDWIMMKYKGFGITGYPQTVVDVSDAIADSMTVEFMAISYYLETTYNKKGMKQIGGLVFDGANIAASCGWFIGLELSKKQEYFTSELAEQTATLLEKVVYVPFWVFSAVMIGYYDSQFGASTRFQKESHLIDTYKGYLSGVRKCFEIGLNG